MAKCSFKQVSKFFIPIYICIAFLPAFSAPRSVAELSDTLALVLRAQPDSVAPADSLTCPEEEDTLEMQELSLPQRLEKLLDNEIFLRTQVDVSVAQLSQQRVHKSWRRRFSFREERPFQKHCQLPFAHAAEPPQDVQHESLLFGNQHIDHLLAGGARRLLR